MAGVKSSGNSYKCSGTNGTFSRRFLSAKFPLKYVSGISKKVYADYDFGKSFIELEFEYIP